MSIKAYNGVPDTVLDEKHALPNGKSYTVRCNDKLAVDMNYQGKNLNSSNSQGWERNSQKYFEQLYQNHPEMFSARNVERIKNKQAPIVDQKFIQHNPQYAQFKNEKLVHHHIGGDGQAAAVPVSIHKGYGEIHNHEKNAGITQSCREFSDKCESYVQAHPNEIGKSASELGAVVEKGQTKSAAMSNNSSVQNGSNAPSSPQKTNASSRSNAVNSVMSSQSNRSNSAVQSRASAVDNVMSDNRSVSAGHSRTIGEGQHSSNSAGKHNSQGR
jgi:hypothetical protein